MYAYFQYIWLLRISLQIRINYHVIHFYFKVSNALTLNFIDDILAEHTIHEIRSSSVKLTQNYLFLQIFSNSMNICLFNKGFHVAFMKNNY